MPKVGVLMKTFLSVGCVVPNCATGSVVVEPAPVAYLVSVSVFRPQAVGATAVMS